MARPRKYSDELRERAVRLVFESERPIAHVARDLGIHKVAPSMTTCRRARWRSPTPRSQTRKG